MDCGVLDSLGGAFPNKVPVTLDIRACRLNSSAPLQGVYSIQIDVSTVTGRFMLKPNLTTTNKYYYTVWFWVFFLAGKSRTGPQRHCYLLSNTTNYYTMLHQLMPH